MFKKLYIISAILVAGILGVGGIALTDGPKTEEIKTFVEVQQQYFDYQVDRDQQQKIYELIHTLSTSNLISLGFKRDHMVRLGDQIDQKTPPLQFLATIFRDPELAKDMSKIKTSRFKYHSFVNGLEANMLKEYRAGRLTKEIGGFAAYLHLNEAQVTKLVEEGVKKAQNNPQELAFRPFVDYLIMQKSRR